MRQHARKITNRRNRGRKKSDTISEIFPQTSSRSTWRRAILVEDNCQRLEISRWKERTPAKKPVIASSGVRIIVVATPTGRERTSTFPAGLTKRGAIQKGKRKRKEERENLAKYRNNYLHRWPPRLFLADDLPAVYSQGNDYSSLSRLCVEKNGSYYGSLSLWRVNLTRRSRSRAENIPASVTIKRSLYTSL